MGRGKRLPAFNTNLSTTRKKANGVNTPLSQPEWVYFKEETLQGPCEDLALHTVCLYARQVSFLFFFGRLLLAPRAGSPNWRLLQLRQNFAPTSALPVSPRSACPCRCFHDHPRYLLLSFPGPRKQRDSLPEGRHLERLLSSLQGDAGPVRAAHAAQQPPEAAVRRRLRHRFVSIGPGRLPWGDTAQTGAGSGGTGDEEEDGNVREEGRSLQSLKSPSLCGPVCLSERLLQEAFRGTAFRRHGLRGQA